MQAYGEFYVQIQHSCPRHYMVSYQLHGPAVLAPDRETQRLGGSQSQFGRFGEESQPLPGTEHQFLGFPKRKGELSYRLSFVLRRS
jgi:hypothetical protein